MKLWIREDFESFHMTYPLISQFTYGENWVLFAYLRTLRHLEYYTNKQYRPLDKLMYAYYWLKHRRDCKRMQLFINSYAA